MRCRLRSGSRERGGKARGVALEGAAASWEFLLRMDRNNVDKQRNALETQSHE